MKRLLLSAAALAAFSAQPALAQDIGLNVTGHVPAMCGSNVPSSGDLDLNAIVHVGASMVGADGHLVPYLDASGSMSLNLMSAFVIAHTAMPPTIWCNGTASIVDLTLEPLIGSNPSTNPQFTNRIDLTVTDLGTLGIGGFDIASVSTVGGGASATGSSAPVGQFSGMLSDGFMTFSTPTGVRPVAGDYTGKITITLRPN